VNHTALVLMLRDLNQVIHPYLEQHSPAAGAGLDAHLTLLFPFLPYDQIDESHLQRLGLFFKKQDPLKISLVGTARFPGQLYLTLSHESGITRLVTAVRTEITPLPVNTGQYSAGTPHVTIARSGSDAALNRLEGLFWQQYRHLFPLGVTIREAALIHEQHGRLYPRHTFSFGVA